MSLSLDLGRYLLKKRLQRDEKFPLVLMLEPTHQCNLSCQGCGRIQEYRETVGQALTLEECLEAVEESGVPVVTITGGEPLIYPPVFELLEELVRRGKHIYLCSNAVLLERSLPKIPVSDHITLSVHLDGLAETHDRLLGRPGLFNSAIKAIKAAKAQGLRVCTNTSIYKATDPREIEILLSYLGHIGVDGLLVSPAFSFAGVEDELFMSREEIKDKFIRLTGNGNRFKFFSTPLYLSFLRGERDYECTPWANPTRNPHGWRSPCYQIADHHYPTFKEMMARTNWDSYGVGKDPRCAQCMMHSGFEPTAVRKMRGFSDLWTMFRWNLT